MSTTSQGGQQHQHNGEGLLASLRDFWRWRRNQQQQHSGDNSSAPPQSRPTQSEADAEHHAFQQQHRSSGAHPPLPPRSVRQQHTGTPAAAAAAGSWGVQLSLQGLPVVDGPQESVADAAEPTHSQAVSGGGSPPANQHLARAHSAAAVNSHRDGAQQQQQPRATAANTPAAKPPSFPDSSFKTPRATNRQLDSSFKTPRATNRQLPLQEQQQLLHQSASSGRGVAVQQQQQQQQQHQQPAEVYHDLFTHSSRSPYVDGSPWAARAGAGAGAGRQAAAPAAAPAVPPAAAASADDATQDLQGQQEPSWPCDSAAAAADAGLDEPPSADNTSPANAAAASWAAPMPRDSPSLAAAAADDSPSPAAADDAGMRSPSGQLLAPFSAADAGSPLTYYIDRVGDLAAAVDSPSPAAAATADSPVTGEASRAALLAASPEPLAVADERWPDQGASQHELTPDGPLQAYSEQAAADSPAVKDQQQPHEELLQQLEPLMLLPSGAEPTENGARQQQDDDDEACDALDDWQQEALATPVHSPVQDTPLSQHTPASQPLLSNAGGFCTPPGPAASDAASSGGGHMHRPLHLRLDSPAHTPPATAEAAADGSSRMPGLSTPTGKQQRSVSPDVWFDAAGTPRSTPAHASLSPHHSPAEQMPLQAYSEELQQEQQQLSLPWQRDLHLPDLPLLLSMADSQMPAAADAAHDATVATDAAAGLATLSPAHSLSGLADARLHSSSPAAQPGTEQRATTSSLPGAAADQEPASAALSGHQAAAASWAPPTLLLQQPVPSGSQQQHERRPPATAAVPLSPAAAAIMKALAGMGAADDNDGAVLTRSSPADAVYQWGGSSTAISNPRLSHSQAASPCAVSGWGQLQPWEGAGTRGSGHLEPEVKVTPYGAAAVAAAEGGAAVAAEAPAQAPTPQAVQDKLTAAAATAPQQSTAAAAAAMAPRLPASHALNPALLAAALGGEQREQLAALAAAVLQDMQQQQQPVVVRQQLAPLEQPASLEAMQTALGVSAVAGSNPPPAAAASAQPMTCSKQPQAESAPSWQAAASPGITGSLVRQASTSSPCSTAPLCHSQSASLATEELADTAAAGGGETTAESADASSHRLLAASQAERQVVCAAADAAAGHSEAAPGCCGVAGIGSAGAGAANPEQQRSDEQQPPAAAAQQPVLSSACPLPGAAAGVMPQQLSSAPSALLCSPPMHSQATAMAAVDRLVQELCPGSMFSPSPTPQQPPQPQQQLQETGRGHLVSLSRLGSSTGAASHVARLTQAAASSSSAGCVAQAAAAGSVVATPSQLQSADQPGQLQHTSGLDGCMAQPSAAAAAAATPAAALCSTPAPAEAAATATAAASGGGGSRSGRSARRGLFEPASHQHRDLQRHSVSAVAQQHPESSSGADAEQGAAAAAAAVAKAAIASVLLAAAGTPAEPAPQPDCTACHPAAGSSNAHDSMSVDPAAPQPGSDGNAAAAAAGSGTPAACQPEAAASAIEAAAATDALPAAEEEAAASCRAVANTEAAEAGAEGCSAPQGSAQPAVSPQQLSALLDQCSSQEVLPAEACRMMLANLQDCLTPEEQQQVLQRVAATQPGAQATGARSSVCSKRPAAAMQTSSSSVEPPRAAGADSSFAAAAVGGEPETAAPAGPQAACDAVSPAAKRRRLGPHDATHGCAASQPASRLLLEEEVQARFPGVSAGYLCALACLGVDVKGLLVLGQRCESEA